MTFVLDASVTLAWLFRDEESPYTRRIRRRLDEEAAAVPAIWALEVSNGLLTAERRGRLIMQETAEAHGILADLPIEYDAPASGQVLAALLDLGRARSLSAYDAAYLELARRLGLSLATQDSRLRTAAESIGVPLAE